jgi:hypothetical protein
MKGYKASYNGRCRRRKFEVGKTYTLKNKPKLCKYGFHFCQNADDTLHYYDYRIDFVLFEIEAIGDIVTRGDKSCTNEIKIVRIIPRNEYPQIFKDTPHVIDTDGNLRFTTSCGYEYVYNKNDKLISITTVAGITHTY